MERSTVNAPKSLTEIFDEVCPWYLMAGMTYEQFWDGDPGLCPVFRRKLELEDKRFNERAWLQGEYNYIAVATAVSNAFRKKGTKPAEYPKEPFNVGTDTALEAEAKRQKAFDDSIAFMARMRGSADGGSNH